MADHPFTSLLAAAEAEAAIEARRLRALVVLAALAHLLALWIVLPTEADEPADEPKQAIPFEVQVVRVKEPPPPPPPAERKPDRPRRPIPVPEAEPLVPEVVIPEPVPLPVPEDVSIVVIPAPPAPPAPPEPEPSATPVRIGGEVRPPARIHFVEPRYTEAARKIRLQGTVILDTVIDPAGQIVDVKVLKSLPLGLTEAAVDAVAQWRFEPTTIDGRPVPVAYVVTVRYGLR